MLASAAADAVPRSTMAASGLDYMLDRSPSGKRQFKKHKTLPHPIQDRSTKPRDISDARPRHARPYQYDLIVDTTSSSKPSSQTSSPSRQRRAGAPGPDLPPTPPAHSRNSSSSHSILPSTPTIVGSPVQSAADVSLSTKTPTTPPNQKSPPTPDVTPPQPGRRPQALRPNLASRIPSKATTDSRTESFKTARENPYSSDEEDRSTLRPVVPSARSSQNTVRHVPEPQQRQRQPQTVGLGLGLESDDNLTPRTREEFFRFDGGWDSNGEVEQEWDENLNRNVMVRRRQTPPRTRKLDAEVIEDVTVTPTMATKALRSMPLHDRIRVESSPASELAVRKQRATAPSISQSSLNTDVRRSSGMSTKSTASTVVEAILVGAPPARQRTLRHVRKHTLLRDSSTDVSSTASALSSLAIHEEGVRPRLNAVAQTPRAQSFASTGTSNSISSRKARREVWKNGGIPVVVVPDRLSSVRANDAPSLRSVSSRRSKRSNSLSSVPLSQISRSKDLTPLFDRPSRRGRTMSESDGSTPGDQRTIDYPPVVPVRTSSLSAPTSRNNSRAGSLTTESLKARDAIQGEQQIKLPKVTVEPAPPVETPKETPERRPLQPSRSVDSHKTTPDIRGLVDQNGDPFFGKRLTTHNTPFSQASIETNGTHSVGEVSEAMAVQMYPHQNKSVLMVDHTHKLPEPPQLIPLITMESPEEEIKETTIQKPTITTTGPDGAPVTPPQQQQLSMDDVDSPLRNPRAPPEPPAIKFIAATPSGLTPAEDKMKMMGNYFEEADKRPSLVRRAFSLRRNNSERSEKGAPTRPGFLSRTLSLSKNIRRETAENPEMDKRASTASQLYPNEEEPPADEGKLHPFWRPAHSDNEWDEGEDWVYDVPAEVEKMYRYPPIDNRPHRRRRSLSERMKRTFAILPLEPEDDYYMSPAGPPRHDEETDRRTVKRTTSGNLRVVRRSGSSSTLSRRRRSSRTPFPSADDYDDNARPATAPDRSGKKAWGIQKHYDGQGRRFFPSKAWGPKLEQNPFQTLQRKISEKRRQKRSDELRQKISGPREVRDGVGEVIKRASYSGPSYQTSTMGANDGFVDEDQAHFHVPPRPERPNEI